MVPGVGVGAGNPRAGEGEVGQARRHVPGCLGGDGGYAAIDLGEVHGAAVLRERERGQEQQAATAGA